MHLISRCKYISSVASIEYQKKSTIHDDVTRLSHARSLHVTQREYTPARAALHTYRSRRRLTLYALLPVSSPAPDTIYLGGAPVGFLGHAEAIHDLGVVGVINMCGEYQGPVEEYGRLGIEQLWLPTVVRIHTLYQAKPTWRRSSSMIKAEDWRIESDYMAHPHTNKSSYL